MSLSEPEWYKEWKKESNSDEGACEVLYNKLEISSDHKPEFMHFCKNFQEKTGKMPPKNVIDEWKEIKERKEVLQEERQEISQDKINKIIKEFNIKIQKSRPKATQEKMEKWLNEDTVSLVKKKDIFKEDLIQKVCKKITEPVPEDKRQNMFEGCVNEFKEKFNDETWVQDTIKTVEANQLNLKEKCHLASKDSSDPLGQEGQYNNCLSEKSNPFLEEILFNTALTFNPIGGAYKESTSDEDKRKEELKKDQIHLFCGKLTTNIRDQDKQIRQYNACSEILGHLLDEERIRNEFKNLYPEDFDIACRIIVDQAKGKLGNIKTKNAIKNCSDFFRAQKTIKEWLDLQTALKTTFLYNELLELESPLQLRGPYLILRDYGDYMRMIKPWSFQDKNIMFIMQSLTHDAKRLLDTYSNQVKFKNNPDYFTRYKNKPYNVNKEYFAKNLDKQKKLLLLAVNLLTDGNLYVEKGENYRIKLTNKDWILLFKFMDLIREFVPNAHFIVEEKKKEEDEEEKQDEIQDDLKAFDVSIHSEDLAKLLFEISPTYIHTPYDTLQECEDAHGIGKCVTWNTIHRPSNEYKNRYFPPATYKNIIDKFKNYSHLNKEVLRVIADTEGSVMIDPDPSGDLTKTIKISCLHPILAQEIIKMLNKVEITPTPETVPASKFDGKILIPYEFHKKFHDEINFSRGVQKHKGKYFLGYNKSDLLDLMILIEQLRKQHAFVPAQIPNIFENLKTPLNNYKKSLDKGVDKTIPTNKLAEDLCKLYDDNKKAEFCLLSYKIIKALKNNYETGSSFGSLFENRQKFEIPKEINEENLQEKLDQLVKLNLIEERNGIYRLIIKKEDLL